MRAMGIDISTKTGVSLISDFDNATGAEGLVFEESYEVEFPNLRSLDRAHQMAAHLLDQYVAFDRPDIVVLEDYAYSNAHTLVTLVELSTIIRYAFWLHPVYFITVSPSALKKFVTGKGNSNKDQVLLHLFKKWGFTGKTNNIADATGLALFGMCHLNPTLFKAPEKAVLADYKKPKAPPKKKAA